MIDPIPNLRTARQDIPDGLDAIYRKLMARVPEDRFTSANELAEALAPFASTKGAATPRGRESIAASDSSPTASKWHRELPDRTIQQVGAAADPLSSTSTWTPEAPAVASLPSGAAPPRRPGKQRLLAAGGAAALVLMLGVIIITITNQDGTKTKIEVPGDSKVEITTKGDDARKTGWHDWPADAPKPAIAPFDAEQAKQHQEAWAKYLGVPVEYTNTIGMELR